MYFSYISRISVARWCLFRFFNASPVEAVNEACFLYQNLCQRPMWVQLANFENLMLMASFLVLENNEILQELSYCNDMLPKYNPLSLSCYTVWSITFHIPPAKFVFLLNLTLSPWLPSLLYSSSEVLPILPFLPNFHSYLLCTHMFTMDSLPWSPSQAYSFFTHWHLVLRRKPAFGSISGILDWHEVHLNICYNGEF